MKQDALVAAGARAGRARQVQGHADRRRGRGGDRAGLRDGGREAEELPVADGGEGTADALVRALGGEWREAEATDALGRPVEARFGLLDGRADAVVERPGVRASRAIAEGERDAFGGVDAAAPAS